MATLTRNAAPAPKAQTMNLGQVLLGCPVRERRTAWVVRIDSVVGCALATVPQAWEMPR